jgi:hypothetical protein
LPFIALIVLSLGNAEEPISGRQYKFIAGEKGDEESHEKIGMER